VALRKDVVAGLLILATAPVIWWIGRLAHRLPGRIRLVTATIVIVSLVALAVAVTQ